MPDSTVHLFSVLGKRYLCRVFVSIDVWSFSDIRWACILDETDTDVEWKGHRIVTKHIHKLAQRLDILSSRCLIVDNTPETYRHNLCNALPV